MFAIFSGRISCFCAKTLSSSTMRILAKNIGNEDSEKDHIDFSFLKHSITILQHN